MDNIWSKLDYIVFISEYLFIWIVLEVVFNYYYVWSNFNAISCII